MGVWHGAPGRKRFGQHRGGCGAEARTMRANNPAVTVAAQDSTHPSIAVGPEMGKKQESVPWCPTVPRDQTHSTEEDFHLGNTFGQVQIEGQGPQNSKSEGL